MRFEWKTTTLGAVCEAQGGAIQTGPFGSQLHTSDYKRVGIPVVMPTNLGESGIDEAGIARIDSFDVERLSQHKLRVGDIVFSRRGDVTKSALVRPHEVGWLCGTGCLKVRLGNEATAAAKFISYYLRLPETKEWLIRHAVGATMPNLNTGILSAVPINLPPLKVQLYIAAILGAFDDRIALLRKTNVTLEAITQSLFKSWFFDFDPVHAKSKGLKPQGMDDANAVLFSDGFEESVYGVVPKGWMWRHLSDISTIVMGLSPKGDSYNDVGVGVPLINGPVEFGEYFPVRTKWTDSASRLSKTGDLIFCVRGSTTGRRVISDGEYCIGRGVCAIRSLHDAPTFIYQTINFGLERLLAKTTGSVFPSLSAPDIKGLVVLSPPLDVVGAFEKIANPLLQKVQSDQRQIQTLIQLRDTLLPRLISGQLRLPEAEELVEEACA
ncbi:restriction endonuclease S subunit [Pseudomonas sp. GM102]|uniref:restriction endonuclease subunit S n=1 Tax=Pseudomonas sp. GM102 TaxID=1144321 RepID=UPI00026FBCDA|nr:restriction endonuclease subunit S [Pseudomonas sp. GM102]EJM07338.1 restriction endonuclease S subunit [Pseudomonas sp. GM102]